MPSEIDLFREYLLKDPKVTLEQPTTEQALVDFEANFAVSLPADVREFCLKINGMYIGGGFITLELLSEWKRIVEYPYANHEWIAQELGENADYWIRFGAYDILVWEWLILLSPDPKAATPVYVLLYENLTKIADNFSDFLHIFRTTSPEHLLGNH